jgi:uncharacterized protein (TIGR00251 family)
VSADDVATLVISERTSAIRFDVRARPRSKRSEILGAREGALLVAVAAPPVDGEANTELTRVLARALGVALREVTITAGEGGRRKVVEVRGIDRATALARLTASR